MSILLLIHNLINHNEYFLRIQFQDRNTTFWNFLACFTGTVGQPQKKYEMSVRGNELTNVQSDKEEQEQEVNRKNDTQQRIRELVQLSEISADSTRKDNNVKRERGL